MWVLATNALSRGLTDTGIAVGSAAVLAFGAWRVVHGQMGLEVLLVILMMGIEVFRPQRDLRALLHTGMMGRAAADDIFSVLDARAQVEPPAAPVALDGPLAPEVEFENVSFAYPGGRRAAHRELSFRIEAGERVGFVGESGSGGNPPSSGCCCGSTTPTRASCGSAGTTCAGSAPTTSTVTSRW